ncbi:unnamed protein product [Bursaphelenchus okinawaensis]|uniref:RNase H type-1 domain-containing protein n=1 Tax=Bursaphelenchus okinawaensis TaxID=465554 RepID=A0A811K5X4_9BILA|nr:unnamed protein product [Bursaphelenchus okinawaensis]CAG9093425.1 unnamed protein product [Bursaphelenchus okinawaensis]
MNLKRFLTPVNQIIRLDNFEHRKSTEFKRCFAVAPTTSNTETPDRILPGPSITTSSLFKKDDPFVQEIIKHAVEKEDKPKAETSRNPWDDVYVVKTTGVVKSQDRKKVGRIGVFWGKGDQMNVYKNVDSDSGVALSVTLAELDAVILALRQAIFEKNLNQVVVETDSEFVANVCSRFLKAWRNNGFMKADGTPVKNKVFIEELDRLLQQIDAKVVFCQHKTRYTNDVFQSLKAEGDFDKAIEEDKSIHTPQEVISLPSSKSNVIYTSAKLEKVISKSGSSSFIYAGFGIHYPANVKVDDCGRYTRYPITELRTQLSGILRAVQIAKENDLKEVHIVTDSRLFLKFNKLKWLKKDGNAVANKDLYDKIADVTKEMKVHYHYAPPNFNKEMERSGMLAEDGMCLPVVGLRSS